MVVVCEGFMTDIVSAGPVPAAPRRILAIFNPAAGRNRRRKFDSVVALAREAGCDVAVCVTAAPGDAEAMARGAPTERYDLVAAAGGDGTINEVVNGLRGTGIALGIVPLGTANVAADEIGLRRDAAVIARTLAFGRLRRVHLGLCNGRRFAMMAGVGFDANVIGRVSLRLKKILGPLAYVWTAGLQGFRDPYATCDVTIDGAAYTGVSVVACKGRRYGGPFIAAPNADFAKPSFEVILMKGRGWFSVARYGAALIFGKIGIWSDVAVMTGREILVDSTAGQPLQADGDIVAALPARITIDPIEQNVAVP